MPRSVAMKLLGQKTVSVYRRYAIASEADLREGLSRLAALHAAQAEGPRTFVSMTGAGERLRETASKL